MTDSPAPPVQVKVNEPVSPYQVMALRGAIVGCGVLGAYLFIRRSKLFTSLRNVNEIPEAFIRKEMQLKGFIRQVDSNGVFKVEHQPVIGLPRFLRPKKQNQDLLRLRLAALDVSPAGVTYLNKDLKLKDRKVFFQPIKPSAGDPNSFDCDVTVKKNILGLTNLNVDLVRKGYARVYTLDHKTHYDALQSNSAYSRLVTKLLTSEKVAESRGVGVWNQAGWVEKVESLPSAAGQIVRSAAVFKFFNLLWRITVDLFYFTVHLLRHLYHLTAATASLTADAYRRFGRRVDEWIKLYDRLKHRLLGAKAIKKE
ncbi:unnamed protein product [Bursaphelenchus xylophilus]|uniref:(pine wood nematode) hypothetical protein n=1 Tax=Bursaphelenchus xylophilus TaxID=6326 RepID=A0A1I7S9A6_BURXY|nr:unnamed protein product [Bursaphelenchus xylophilus]CAG9100481.1 unnamed protein product [Bursaphelenchus xylophilus]